MTVLEIAPDAAFGTTSVEASRVAAARAGDRDAFGDLVALHWRALVALARVVLAGAPEAEDVVQEAFVLAWRRLPELRRPESFEPWLRRIVVRRCLRVLRQARPTAPLETVAEVPAPTGAETHLDVAAALRILAPRQRAVLYLGAEGYSDREIGAMLGIFAATVRVHRLRARRILRRRLEGYA